MSTFLFVFVVAFVQCVFFAQGFRLSHQFPRRLALKAATLESAGGSTLPEAALEPVGDSILKRVDKDYDAGAITVLEGLDPVRKRPGMYIGSTGQKGLHHLVFEVIDNSVDESLAGHCTNITLTLHNDKSVEVRDNGRGIPTGIHPTTGKSALETVLCVLHAGGKFGGDDSGYKVSGGLHGVGISVVNALSSKLKVDVVRDDYIHTISFEKGLPITGLEVDSAPEGRPRGTNVRFTPDPEIFKTTTDMDFDKLAARVDELAYLNAGLTITMIDKRSNEARKKGVSASQALLISDGNSAQSKEKKKGESLVADERNEEDENGENDDDSTVNGESESGAKDIVKIFRHDGGITELVTFMSNDKQLLHTDIEVIKVSEERKGVVVEAALRWSKDQYSESLTGFANGIRTSDGGSHLDGLKSSISKTINSQLRKTNKLKEKDSNIPGEFCREGLTAVVSVKVPEPEFEGQTKTRLGNPEVREIVDTVIKDALTTLFEWNPTVLSDIGNKAMQAQAAAAAAKAAREMVRRKSLLTSTVLPGKLADCASRDPTETEIYVVEGDSAAGSAKQGRDRRLQAILPLRGKILNIEKASNDKIYGNTELQSLISALGLGIRGAPFDVNTLRYHRIVIMTDADVDGSHIRILLLTFLYRYQPELLKQGFVYIACPPLYKVTKKGKGGKEEYLYDQAEFDKKYSDATNINIQRFKGLGEMMPQQLWETTMDPEKRTLKLVRIEDAAAADRLFTVLMGDNVMPRKEFITTNAERLKLSDLDY